MLPIEADLSRFPQWVPEQQAALHDLIERERAIATIEDAERDGRRKTCEKQRVEKALERGNLKRK
jgi:hypothetical protein